jgi:hypothetical protein
MKRAALLAIWIAMFRASALAQSAPSQGNEQALQAAAANPLASLVSVPFQLNANIRQSPLGGTGATLNIQPVIPVSLSSTTNVIVRTIVPTAYVPLLSTAPNVGQTYGIGPINPQFYFIPSKPKSLIVGPGVTFLLPTSTGPLLGPNKWAAGPDLAIVDLTKYTLYGFIANNVWSFAGSPANVNVNSFFIQPFYTRNFAHGMGITASSQTSANWNAPSGQKWTVPLLITVSQLQLAAGNKPISVSGGVGYNLLRPLNTGTFIVRFQVTLLYPTAPAAGAATRSP